MMVDLGVVKGKMGAKDGGLGVMLNLTFRDTI